MAVPHRAARPRSGARCSKLGVDVLVEKPIAPTLAEAKATLSMPPSAAVRILQVGHLERFNPAVIALERAATLPLFFEIHRMSVFTLRSLDVDVVLDLMIHDLDIISLRWRAQKLKDIRAAGISILSPRRSTSLMYVLSSKTAASANLTASRVSTEKVRKLRLFQPQQYISVDYARQSAAVFTVRRAAGDCLRSTAGRVG